jgi:hypothetical protein
MPPQSPRSTGAKSRSQPVHLSTGVPPSATGLDSNRAPPSDRFSTIGAAHGCEQAESGEVAFGVALSDVDGQVGDGTGVPFVEA